MNAFRTPGSGKIYDWCSEPVDAPTPGPSTILIPGSRMHTFEVAFYFNKELCTMLRLGKAHNSLPVSFFWPVVYISDRSGKALHGGIAQWQSIRLQIERSPVQIRVPPIFFCVVNLIFMASCLEPQRLKNYFSDCHWGLQFYFGQFWARRWYCSHRQCGIPSWRHLQLRISYAILHYFFSVNTKKKTD